MNAKDRIVVWAIRDALASIPGVSNPAAIKGKLAYYNEMSKMQHLVVWVLELMTYNNPEWREEDRADLANALEALGDWVETCRKSRNDSEAMEQELRRRELRQTPEYVVPMLFRRSKAYGDALAALESYVGGDELERQRLRGVVERAKELLADACAGELGTGLERED